MQYDVPGRADAASDEVRDAWNEAILRQHRRLEPGFGSRFFVIDPQAIASPTPTTAVKWFADPAEPVGCLDRRYAQLLSDWGVRGRHRLHNEYAEYRVVHAVDPATGLPRNKRVEITTELREYWVTVARIEPETVRSMATSVLGYEPSWRDLYGVDDPSTLSPGQREVAFSRLVAGHGSDAALASQGVPAQPTGPLNLDHALFMTHPINGLDDLIYIVMFGSKPYARRVNSQLQPATRNQIFRAFGVEHLACRHADPAAAMGAHGQVFNGRTIAFADPLGMYILTFARDLFTYQDGPLPDDWVRFGRGQQGMSQRLEFGPPDSHPAFLDEISVEVGGVPQAVRGGFQVVQQMEVGPIILIGPPEPVDPQEFIELSTSSDAINCHEADVCTSIHSLRDEYEASEELVRTGPRRMGHGG
ncbi:hypothetical protein BH23PLA1_BH23PLA1_36080 [soil metagenome]